MRVGASVITFFVFCQFSCCPVIRSSCKTVEAGVIVNCITNIMDMLECTQYYVHLEF